MQNLYKTLTPERVFYYFEQLTQIPHVSHHTEAISRYVSTFASEKGLSCRADAMGNVIIFKPAGKKASSAHTVMLQSHLDMVGARRDGSNHNFETDPLSLHIENGWLYADGTTLGADDGIGVAVELALLESEDEQLPALECVFTVDEEVGLLGAAYLDLGACRADCLINLDSEEEGVFTVSCAGGIRYDLYLPMEREEMTGCLVSAGVTGGMGGHSGTEIGDHRGNMIKQLNDVLFLLAERTPFTFISMEGGQQDNAIPTSCHSVLLFPDCSFTQAQILWNECTQIVREASADLKGQIEYPFRKLADEAVEENCLSLLSAEQVIDFMHEVPNGIQKMSEDIPGLPETSLNMGICRLTEKNLKLGFSLRSSDEKEKLKLGERLEGLIQARGGFFETSGRYSGWKYDPDSALRKKAIHVFAEMYGKEPVTEALHAGLECGTFKEKMPELDILALGITMKNVHTCEEHLSIESTGRVYEFLRALLHEMAAE